MQQGSASLPLFLLAVWCTLSACRTESDAPLQHVDTLAYVGREVCADCHRQAAEQWTGSDHDLAMSEATEETVLGDFDDAAFTECGVETRFFKRDGRFFIRTQGPEGAVGTFPVEYTFGYYPLQQYLISLSNGRLQAFTVAWDTRAERWFSLYPDECVPPDDWLHWTGSGMTWNYMCADCHSTDLQRNFDLAENRYETTYAEIDVSCEACHGPGERHVEWARVEAEDGSYASGGARPGDIGLTVDLASGPITMDAVQQRPHSDSQLESCAPCHSRRRIVAADFVPGKPFLDHYEPELLREDLYFADGQIQDEVYVYGSFVQSKMYENGVRCADCHDPHSTQLKLEGNALCTQCHEASTYDTFEHIRHPAGEAGSQCVDCHMPQRTYMVVDPRRDHSFRIPRPDLTAEIGTPNACNGCHEDRSPEWAAAAVTRWHGDERPPHFARAVAGGRKGLPEAEAELLRIVSEATAPDIVRATALSLLAAYPTVRSTDAAVKALDDPSPLVRTAAVRSLGDDGRRSLAPKIEPLLGDSARLVRTEAARAMTLIAPGRYAREPESEEARRYWNALEEYRAGQAAVSDQAASHLNLAVIHEHLGDLEAAEDAYRTALRLDSSFVPAHMNLAMLYNRQREEESGRAAELFARAEAELRRAVRLEPDVAEAHYTLGLLLAEDPQRLDEAAMHLERAAELDTTRVRMQYNAGLAHQRLGNAPAAERLLLRAYELEPGHPDYLNALSIFYSQQGRWDEALRFTDLLLQQNPNNRELQERLAYIRQQAGV